MAEEASPASADPVLELLERQLTQGSAERQAQTKAFQAELSGLRWELRIIVLLALLLGAARDGVFAKIGIPGVTIETKSAEATPATLPSAVGSTP